MGSHIRDLGRGSHVLHHDDKESDDWLGSGYQLRILFGHGLCIVLRCSLYCIILRMALFELNRVTSYERCCLVHSLFLPGNDHGRSSPIDSMENSIVRSIVCTQISTSRSLTLPIASQKLDPMRQLDEEMVKLL